MVQWSVRGWLVASGQISLEVVGGPVVSGSSQVGQEIGHFRVIDPESMDQANYSTRPNSRRP